MNATLTSEIFTLKKRGKITFLALILYAVNPSENRVFSAMMSESGTHMAIGRNMDFKLSGNSVRPA